jgi:hypothetical protein
MKTARRVLFVVALAGVVAAAPSCSTVDDSSFENFAYVISLDWRYTSSADGAKLLLTNLIVRFSNDTGSPAQGSVLVEWGNGRTEESNITLPASGGREYTENVWPGIEHGDDFVFKGEKTVTIKLTVRFLGDTSPVYEKTLTMKSL